MAFSTIFIIVIIGYVFVYAGMIAYDLFIKKDPMELVPKVEDEDIDISDEVGQFQPILIDKDAKPNGGKKEQRTAEQANDSSNAADKEQQNTGHDLPPAVSSGTFDDEPDNRKSLNDIEPKAPNKADAGHIRELVKEVRKMMTAEERQEQSNAAARQEGKSREEQKQKVDKAQKKADDSKPTEHPATFKESLRHTPYRSTGARPASSSSCQEKKRTIKPVPVRPWQEKPKKPSGPIPIFERTTKIAKENQQTKLCGGVTAESLSDKLNSYSTAELREMLKRNNEHWELKEKARQPDEDDLEILRINASMKRDKAPTFTRSV